MQSLAYLRESLPSSKILLPSDKNWAEQRATRSVAGHGCKPLGIAVPKTAEEVGTIVRWARTAGVDITVRSGGNDFFGRNVTDDGLIIDMRDIDEITVSRDKKTVTLGGGVITQNLLRALDGEGLIVPCGNTWVVGYVGWATIGGYGPLTHLMGMGFEGIVAAQVVNADGKVIEAGEDLLEGIRGMGGNVGIITSLTVKTYPTRRVFSGMLLMDYSAENMHAVVSAGGNFKFPKAATIHNFVLQIPTPVLAAMIVYAEDNEEQCESFLQDFISHLPRVKMNTVAWKTIIQQMEQVPIHCAAYGGQRSINVTDMSAKITDIAIGAIGRMPKEVNFGWSMKTPVGRQNNASHTFGGPDSHILINFSDMVSEEHSLSAAKGWNDELYEDLRGCGDAAILEGSYPALTRPDDRSAEQLYGDKWLRVKELKHKYDPEGMFKHASPAIIL